MKAKQKMHRKHVLKIKQKIRMLCKLPVFKQINIFPFLKNAWFFLLKARFFQAHQTFFLKTTVLSKMTCKRSFKMCFCLFCKLVNLGKQMGNAGLDLGTKMSNAGLDLGKKAGKQRSKRFLNAPGH